jgi:photosynthetic reaction center H subunit
MGTGAITEYIDVAQLVLYAFWIFFFGLIFYLQRESKREGYPMETDRPGRTHVDGLLPMPSTKTYKLHDGSSVSAPHTRDHGPKSLAARPTAGFPGAPLEPTGNPMLGNVGPGSYTNRMDVAERMWDGSTLIVPLRAAAGSGVSTKDTDPRGLPVVGADGVVGGTVKEVWVDRAEMLVRFLEVSVPNGAKGPQVLLPMNFARVDRDKVRVASIMGAHFANVPRTRNPDAVTSLEEEKIMAYYGAGTLYADPRRAEPAL